MQQRDTGNKFELEWVPVHKLAGKGGAEYWSYHASTDSSGRAGQLVSFKVRGV